MRKQAVLRKNTTKETKSGLKQRKKWCKRNVLVQQIGAIQKNICTNLYEKGLNSSQEIEEHHKNEPPK